VIVEAIPRLVPQRRNEARRFNILIDTLYEARTLLIASAEVPPEEIYIAGDGNLRVPTHRLAPDRDAERGLHRQPPAAVKIRPTCEFLIE